MSLDQILQWAIPAALVVGGFLVGLLFERLIIKVLVRLAKGTKWLWDDIIIKSFKRAFVIWITCAFAWGGVVYAPLQSGSEKLLLKLLMAAATFMATLVLARLASGFADLWMGRLGGGVPSATLLSNVIKVSVIAIGVVFILSDLGINIAPLITALGIGGLAAALALKDTLSNLFAGLQIIASRQVRPGDYVRLDSGELGEVTDVNWRNVTISSHPDQNLIIVPNSKLASAVMINYNLPKKQLIEIVEVGVAYDSDLEHVEKVALEVASETIRDISGEELKAEPQIRFRTFGDSSINLQVRLSLPALKGRGVYKSEFIKRLHKRFAREGIVIPFPIRTVYMKGQKPD